MKLFEIMQKIEAEFPPESAYEWDNVGLLAGEGCSEIKKVMVTLDINRRVIDEAAEWGADLIISHHPILFSPINKINDQTETGRMLLKAIRNGINIYAAHTNCDVGKNGINAYLAELFELLDAQPLEETGLGRIGNLKKEMCFSEFAELVRDKLQTPRVRVSGDCTRMVRRVAIGSGACADSIPTAISKGADVMLTADMKYHNMIDYTEAGINIIDAGHYPTERCAAAIFAEILADCPIEIKEANTEDIFKYI